MTISINDLHIYESEVMTNASNGGGGMTTNAIIDGASNNIFDDVSEPDRAYGKVNQRKLFMACKSANSDKLFSSLTYISKLPLDEKIGVNLVKTSDYFDRVNARTIETRNSIAMTEHSGFNITAKFAPIVTYQSIKYSKALYFPKFNLLTGSAGNDLKSFYASVFSVSGNTATIKGFDGLDSGSVTGDAYTYGVSALTKFFQGNNFLLNNVDCAVSYVDFTEYVDTTNTDLTNGTNSTIQRYYYLDSLKKQKTFLQASYQDFASYINAITVFLSNSAITLINNDDIAGGITANYIETIFVHNTLTSEAIPVGYSQITRLDNVISKPQKKFTITLTLDKNAGTGVAESLKPINVSAINAPNFTTKLTENAKKLFTAKKITAAITANSSDITITDNENNIIPTVNGITLSDSILGIDSSQFNGDYFEDEIFGIYNANQTVILPVQNVLSVKVESVNGDAVQALSNYTTDLLLGIITFNNTIPTLSDLKLRITYHAAQKRMAFLSGDVVAIINDKETTGTYTTGQTVTLSRQNLAKISVRDSAKNLVLESKFTTDLAAGTVTFTNVSGLSQPLTIIDRLEDFGLVKSIAGNVLTLHKPVVNAYPIIGTVVSNCLMHGDLQATASGLFDQQTWTNVWQDSIIGSSTSAQFNQIDYPIVVSNFSTPTERWILLFKTATTFDVIGEHLGSILTNQSVSVNLSPINPHTSQPYFTIAAAGFGSGWSAGNVIRFNTYSASAPFWVVQTIAQGAATNPDFNFAIEVRGDIDAI